MRFFCRRFCCLVLTRLTPERARIANELHYTLQLVIPDCGVPSVTHDWVHRNAACNWHILRRDCDLLARQTFRVSVRSSSTRT